MEVQLPERRRSSVARLTQGFRRTSASSVKSDAHEEGRFNNMSLIESSRRPSLARLLKGKGRATAEITGSETPRPPDFDAPIFLLPNEIQVHIVCNLHWRDLLTLRRTSHGFHYLLSHNESNIVRRHIRHPDFDLPPYCLSLFPPPKFPTPLSLDYMFGITHRHAVAIQLAQVITRIVRDKIYAAPNAPDHYRMLEPKCKNMVTKLIPGLFTLFNFFESYRRILLKRVSSIATTPTDEPLMSNVSETLMTTYEPATLFQAHQIYQILFSTFTRALRPPSYAGTLERQLRGWHKTPANQRDMAKLLIFGGLREVKNVIRCTNYNARLAALETFVLSLGFGGGKKSGVPAQSARLAALPCSVMAPLETRVAAATAPYLPKLNEIWFDVAPQVMLKRGVVKSLGDLPDMYDSMSRMLQDGVDLELEQEQGQRDPNDTRSVRSDTGPDSDLVSGSETTVSSDESDDEDGSIVGEEDGVIAVPLDLPPAGTVVPVPAPVIGIGESFGGINALASHA